MLPELQTHADELLRNRERLGAILASLSEAEWNTPQGAEHYSARETVAHLSGGALSMVRLAENWMSGEQVKLRPDFDLDKFNARQQEKRASKTNAELVAEWHGAQDTVIALMEKVRPEDLDKRGEHPVEGEISVRRLFGVITEHEQMHIQELAGAES